MSGLANRVFDVLVGPPQNGGDNDPTSVQALSDHNRRTQKKLNVDCDRSRRS